MSTGEFLDHHTCAGWVIANVDPTHAVAIRATYVISQPRVLTWMRRAFAGTPGAKLALADR